MLKNKNSSLIFSYLTLRKLIGILGILLPFACLLGGSLFQNKPVMDSISAYYHSNMRDILTGLLVGVSLFLLTYKGYELRDWLIAILSGVAGLGIAIFPCESRIEMSSAVGVFQLTPPIAGYLHYGSSALFFILLGVNSFFLFTIGDKENWTKSKTVRNGIYRACGLVIFASLLTLAIFSLILRNELITTVWTLVFETIMLLAFGISWLVKGETLFADKPNEKRFNVMMVPKDAVLKS
ncbi:MAG TPA: hypothetical protein VMT35_19295 [Ignavibacteriaceae bacterium]|nr:hypothetical protein [Ignavibacteriaceae bacterium]